MDSVKDTSDRRGNHLVLLFSQHLLIIVMTTYSGTANAMLNQNLKMASLIGGACDPDLSLPVPNSLVGA